MHDDATAILRSYTEEALAKSRKETRTKLTPAPKTSSVEQSNDTGIELAGKESRQKSLETASEEELVHELARRRAERYRLAGAMAPNARTMHDDYDPTGQVCSLNGGNGTIPCRELME
jgi:hypothetical protein